MKRLWARIVDWVKWRWTLPARLSPAEGNVESLTQERDRWRARCEKAEMPTRDWKRAYEREAAHGKELQCLFEETLAESRALANDRTSSGLTAAEVERLGLLAMAAGKLAADAAKVVLHGWKSPSRFTGRSAYAEVEHSMGRLAAAVDVMVDAGDVRGVELRAHAARAKQRIGEQATRQ